ncbi:MAG: hypothetical protein M1482_18165 [Chloroflexi bacterium]|nr:hypothetical protein [Chloroflexota bacterium]
MTGAPGPRAVRTARQRAIERQIDRLRRRILPFQVVSNRVSWARVAVFAGGIAAAIAAATRVSPLAGWGVLALAALLFALVVSAHRRLERWIDTFAAWRDIKLDQLARMTLDWPNLGAPAAANVPGGRSLALDLDLTGARSVHQLLDTTVSRPGSQMLAQWLVQPSPDLNETLGRQRIVRELVPLTRFRDRFRLTLRMVMQEQLMGEGVSYWLAIESNANRLKWALFVATALAAVDAALFALFWLAGWPAFWAITLAAYVLFFFVSQGALGEVMGALVQSDVELDRFAAIFRYLERYRYDGHPNVAALCEPFRDPGKSPSASMRRIKIAAIGVGLRSNPVLLLVLNVALPWDFFFAYLGDRYRTQVAQAFPKWADTCYRLDALMALANFGYLNPDYTFPELTPAARPILRVEGLGHPLVPAESKVCNDFVVDAPGELAIITGSNMAGKTTFLRSIGVNLCLAYAGGPVNAARFCSVPFRLHTCIRITESVVDGFSYFYAEVKCLRRLLDELRADSPLPLFYLIDEIFRGTNNRERLIGSRAYVHALIGANGAGLLATHDLELAGLAEHNPGLSNYHFADQVSDGRLVFDYRIRGGSCPTTNALKIMQMEGLPTEAEAAPPRKLDDP